MKDLLLVHNVYCWLMIYKSSSLLLPRNHDEAWDQAYTTCCEGGYGWLNSVYPVRLRMPSKRGGHRFVLA